MHDFPLKKAHGPRERFDRRYGTPPLPTTPCKRRGSQRLLFSHEILEASTLVFEIAIVLVSVRALVESRLLTVVTGMLGVCSIASAIVGLLL